MIAWAVLIAGLVSCGDAERPQSRSVGPSVAPTEAQQITITMGAEVNPVANPVSLDTLTELWPAFGEHPSERSRLAVAALNLTPGPCASCSEGSLANCAVDRPGDCPVVGKLVERAILLAAQPTSTLEEIRSVVNYPDDWFALPQTAGPVLGQESAPVRVDLFLDLAGAFAFETGNTLAVLRNRYPADVRIHLHPNRGLSGHALHKHGQRPELEAFLAALFARTEEGKAKAWSEADLTTIGAEMGLALETGWTDTGTGAIRADLALADRVGAAIRPTWFVAGHRLRGAQSSAALRMLIDREIGG